MTQCIMSGINGSEFNRKKWRGQLKETQSQTDKNKCILENLRVKLRSYGGLQRNMEEVAAWLICAPEQTVVTTVGHVEFNRRANNNYRKLMVRKWKNVVQS